MGRKVLMYKNLPTRLPVVSTTVAWLLLDRLQAPGWVWGAVGAFYVLIWIICLYGFWTEENIDIFGEKK